MTGVVSIKVSGETYTMNFGMMAVEIIGQRMMLNGDNASVIKGMIDIIYAGLVNEAYLNGTAPMTYRETSELVDEILELENSKEIQNQIFDCYNGSKAGKKVLEALESMIPKEEKKSEVKKTGTKSRSTPTLQG